MNEDNKEIIFKVKSFRTIPNPYLNIDLPEDEVEDSTAVEKYPEKIPEMYYIVCDVVDVPDNIPMDTNPREQKLTTAVPKRIEQSLMTPYANNFYLLNRGLLLSAEKVAFNSKNNTVSVFFSDSSVHGDVDGGHTYRIIQQHKNELKRGQQFVKIEILTGVEDFFQELADARNTSNQVQRKSIAELYDRFEMIKQAVKNEPFVDDIYYEENGAGSIDVADILSILNLFNIDKYHGLNDYAIISYSGKQRCIDNYIEEHIKYGDSIKNPYMKMSKIMVDIFKIYDQLEKNVSDYYNHSGGKKYGLVVGVTKRKDGKPAYKTKFYKNNTNYLSPNGFLIPIMGAFRALIIEGTDGYYYWKKDPFAVMDKLGPELVEAVVETSRTLGNNPNATGKNKPLWKNLLQCVAIQVLSGE